MGVKRVLIPHSGNACTGLCQPPCPHADCWQCADISAANRARSMGRAREREAEREAAQKSILTAMPVSRMGQQTTVREKAIVERSVLEDIVRRAGMTMSWNDGRPNFSREEQSAVEGGSFEDAMRAKGASDEDIAAARKVMGGGAQLADAR